MAKRSVPENLGRFRRIPVYRGAGLGRFHCTEQNSLKGLKVL